MIRKSRKGGWALREDIIWILERFIAWRVALYVFLFLVAGFFPLQRDFLGGGRALYLHAPYLWGWVNFDGEHYLSIARDGYRPLTEFYFPLYPLLTRIFASPFEKSTYSLVYSGLVISHIAFLLGLVGLWKLLKLDYEISVIKKTILLLLVFPTSFYFASLYTESLFFCLVVWSFYCARKRLWLFSALLASFASATRIIGIVMLPALLIEWWVQQQEYKRLRSSLLFLLLVPMGLAIYMYYLAKMTGDPLIFFNTVEIFGDQRSSKLIPIFQVFYRYIFKIIPNLSFYGPALFTIILEFVVGILFFLITLASFWKIRASYWIFLAGGYFIPPLSGSFSSMSRYVLVLFPAFIFLSVILDRLPRLVQVIVFGILFVCLAIATSLFIRGFWVA